MQLGNPSQLMWKIHGPSIISPQPSFSFTLKSQSVKQNVHPLRHPSPLRGCHLVTVLIPHWHHIHLHPFSYGHKCWANPSSLSLNLEEETYACRTSSLLAMRWKTLSTRYWMESTEMEGVFFWLCFCQGVFVAHLNLRFRLTSWQACLILSTIPSSPKYCNDNHSGRARSLSAGLFDVRPATKVWKSQHAFINQSQWNHRAELTSYHWQGT